MGIRWTPFFTFKGSPLGCPRRLGSKVIGSVGHFTPAKTPFISRWNNPLILTIDPIFLGHPSDPWQTLQGFGVSDTWRCLVTLVCPLSFPDVRAGKPTYALKPPPTTWVLRQNPWCFCFFCGGYLLLLGVPFPLLEVRVFHELLRGFVEIMTTVPRVYFQGGS